MSHPSVYDLPCPRFAMGRCCLAVERLKSLGDLARIRPSTGSLLAFASETERKVRLIIGTCPSSCPSLTVRVQGAHSNPNLDPSYCGSWLHLGRISHHGNKCLDRIPAILLPSDKGCVAGYFRTVHSCVGHTELLSDGCLWPSDDHDKILRALSNGWRCSIGGRLRPPINSQRQQ